MGKGSTVLEIEIVQCEGEVFAVVHQVVLQSFVNSGLTIDIVLSWLKT